MIMATIIQLEQSNYLGTSFIISGKGFQVFFFFLLYLLAWCGGLVAVGNWAYFWVLAYALWVSVI